MQTYFRNRLPHIAPVGATFFVTFRLADSLPQTVFQELEAEFLEQKRKLPPETDSNYGSELARLKEHIFGRYEHQLDEARYGECILENPDAAKILVERLQEFHNKLYDLKAYCIMPNHVHLIFGILSADGSEREVSSLPKIMQLIKGGSSRYINQKMGRKGPVWARDYFDRYMRSDQDLDNKVNYLLQNPVKAGLANHWRDWPWTGCSCP